MKEGVKGSGWTEKERCSQIIVTATEQHYPVHEKELLTIIHALKKWHANLLGHPIYVYTNHHTL
jgi:hypothetical protein